MIDSLTAYQEAQLSVYSDKWIKIGLDTDRIDMNVIPNIIHRIYTQSNLTPPDKIEVYDSPFEAIEAMQEKYGVRVNLHDFVYGVHDATWLSFFDYFRNVVGVDSCEKIDPLIDLAKNCGWALFYEDMVVLTQKPCKVKFDDRNRTHCEDGYAIEYSDGTGVAIWHGQRIPSEWVFDKSTITPEVMLKWENIEQRRCACEIIGWSNVIELLDPVILDKDSDPEVGTLIEVDLPEVGKEKFLLALDPNTGNQIGLPVPPEMTTALGANSWTYGIDKVEFKPDIRV